MAYLFEPSWEELKRRARLAAETCAEVELRLIAGAREYGDVSWCYKPAYYFCEIRQELLDVCGWSVLLLDKLEGDQRQELAEICKMSEVLAQRLTRLEKEVTSSGR